MTVAYLVISELEPERVTRLTATLRAGSPRAVIAVHHDEAAGSLDLLRVRGLGVDVLDTAEAPAGSAAEMLMLVRCLRVLLGSARFDWLVLLSADEYPVRPVSEIEASLAAVDADAVMERHACPAPKLRHAATVDEPALRYHYRWSRVPGPIGPAARGLAAALRPRMMAVTRPDGLWLGAPAKRSPFHERRLHLPPIRRNPFAGSRARTPFGEGLQCWYGPWRFALSRDAVAAVQASVLEHPELALYYRDTLHPAESYVHTVLGNDPLIRVRADDRRRWRSGESIGVGEIDEVLRSGADFAGPFEPAALDAVDARVHKH
ncbi:MAG TPA: hypothetical protein VFW09_06290 [Solirubrobacteraceae bacterium]|nr:hypothetical protein [Solirubrobacteraceae bacterium]